MYSQRKYYIALLHTLFTEERFGNYITHAVHEALEMLNN